MTQPANKRLVTEAALVAYAAARWQATHAYLANDLVLAPDGTIIQRNTNGTSRASYDATEQALWTVKTSGGGGAAATVSPLTRTSVKTANYTAALWDLVPCDTSGAAFTVTLPAASTGKGRVAIKLVTAGNTLNLALSGSDKFNTSTGATTGTLTLANQGIIVESDGSGIWTITADDLPLTQLATQFAAKPVTTVQTGITGTKALTLPAGADIAYDLTLAGNTTFTLSGGTSGQLGTITLVLRQDATAGRTATFPAAVAWPGQSVPSLNLGAGKYDVVQLSTIDGGTTWFGSLVASAIQPITAPPAPISLAASPSHAQTILTWADAGTGGSTITGHKVYRGTTSGGETLLTTLGAVLTYTDTGLTDGTAYFYKVTAVNALGESAQSAELPSTPGRYLNITTGGASTPNLAGQAPGTGTIDMRALVQMSNWVPAANNFIMSKWHSTAANNQYALFVDATGKLNLAWYNSAGAFTGVPSTVPLNQPAGGTKWVRALGTVGSGTIAYYTSDDGTNWTQLGTTITGLTTTAVQTPTVAQPLVIGQTASGTAQFAGKVYKAQLLIAGSVVNGVDYTTAAAGATTVTGTQGETWTTISPAAVV